MFSVYCNAAHLGDFSNLNEARAHASNSVRNGARFPVAAIVHRGEIIAVSVDDFRGWRFIPLSEDIADCDTCGDTVLDNCPECDALANRNSRAALMGEIEQMAISHGVECRIYGGRLQVLAVGTQLQPTGETVGVETWIDAPATIFAMRRWLGY